MRLPCPHCGWRDLAEFVCRGDAAPRRPDGLAASPDAMSRYVLERDNPAGPLREHWFHAHGCRAWFEIERDTRTHAITRDGAP